VYKETAATWADADPATLAGLPATGAAPVRPEPYRDRGWHGRGRLLAVAGVIAAAGLVIWLLAGMLGGAAPQRPSAVPHAGVRTPATAAPRTVEVNAAALDGQRAGLVVRRLRQDGLNPRLVWATDGGQDPGTVISVHPSGQVPARSVVLVTAARRPPGHHHGHDHGHGGDQGGNRHGGSNGGG